MMHAYCYGSGQIEFGMKIPKGCLPIARGPSKELQAWISGVARHAYDGETLLVPGIPEAPDQFVALDALKKFTLWITRSAPKCVTTIHSKHYVEP